MERVELGGFFQILEYYKIGIDVGLVVAVNQVRRCRSWVAHGKRGDPVENVNPSLAFERLSRFLTALGVSPSPEAAPEAPIVSG